MGKIVKAWTGRALFIIINVRVSYLVIPFFSEEKDISTRLGRYLMFRMLYPKIIIL